MHQLIEECCEEVPEEQKQNIEKTMLDLVKICHHKQFLCMHDDVDDIIESALDSKLLSINSINSQFAPILSTKEPENSLSMGYEHLSITPEMEYDEVTESNAENLFPIPSECEITLEDKRECDELICENSSTIDVCDNHSEILFDSNNDDISSDDESFEDIEYVDASVPDPAIVSVEEENVVQREEKEFCFEIEPDQERSINLVENDNSDSSNGPLLEEADLFLSDNSIPPGIENFADDPEGDIHFLEELLINDSILSHESFDSSFEDSPSNSRPPPEPPDDNFDLEPKVISAVMEDNDEPDEYFNLGGEIFVSTNNEDVDYFPFMFVIRIFLPYLIFPEISPLLLSTESEDTIFDPGISK
uniref:Uncharacterized protein n=1 Tax=Tanacetum cinerariifolium TaxID=118510 RepID=A0A6L2NA27_TANCI|nr:hypothetical protein [Tanacetum cinerariifolium]